VSGGHSYDFEQLSSDLNLAVLNFNSRGSNFVLDFVTSFTTVITQFRPMSGSTYIKTPSSIAKKQAVINVRNYDRAAVFSGVFWHVSIYQKVATLVTFQIIVSITTP